MDEFDKRVAVQLGRRVRRRRHFLDLSQETVAERAGIHRTQISLYEEAAEVLAEALASRLIRRRRDRHQRDQFRAPDVSQPTRARR